MSALFELSDRAVDLCAAADPIVATQIGVPGTTIAGQISAPPVLRADASSSPNCALRPKPRTSRVLTTSSLLAVIRAALSEWIDTIDNGDYRCDLNSIASPHQALRQTFELMATENATDWTRIAVRLESIR